MTKSEKTTKKPKPPAVKPDLSKVTVFPKPGETEHEAIARFGINPNVQALSTIMAFQVTMPKEHAHGDALLKNLDQQSTMVQAGDLSGPEAMLSAHAHALDSLFHHLAYRANTNLNAGYIGNAETYLRLALKAQSQCRTTIEALAEIKSPKSATFIKQANIANQQQVNNGQAPADGNPSARAQEKDITPTTELLTESVNATVDAGRTGAAIGINQGLETVGRLNRSKN